MSLYSLRPLEDDSAKEELEGAAALEIAFMEELDSTSGIALLVGLAAELEGTAELKGAATELLAGAELEGAAAELLLGVASVLEDVAFAEELCEVTAVESLALESFEVIELELSKTSLFDVAEVAAELETLDELDFLRDVEDFEAEDCVPIWAGLFISSELSESGIMLLSLEISSYCAKKSISVPLSSVQP